MSLKEKKACRWLPSIINWERRNLVQGFSFWDFCQIEYIRLPHFHYYWTYIQHFLPSPCLSLSSWQDFSSSLCVTCLSLPIQISRVQTLCYNFETCITMICFRHYLWEYWQLCWNGYYRCFWDFLRKKSRDYIVVPSTIFGFVKGLVVWL